MRIFVAGATGAVGRRLVPLLVLGGHHVIGTTSSPEKLDRLADQGVEAVVVDGLDRESVMRAVVAAHPDVIVHEMTALASLENLKHFDEEFAITNRLRTEGTRHLLAAAHEAGARRFVAQSYAGWMTEQAGSRVKTEDDPLDQNPPAAVRKIISAIRELEHIVLNADLQGIVLRYGNLYGPGTSLADNGRLVQMVRQRHFPLVGSAAGVWSFIHVDDAARATQRAIEHGAPGIYNIVDDEPAEVAMWLPDLASVVGAKPPRHVPAWLCRFLIGAAGVLMMTAVRGSSNAKAKRELGWQPEYGSWRDGFRRGLSAVPPIVEHVKSG